MTAPNKLLIQNLFYFSIQKPKLPTYVYAHKHPQRLEVL